MIKVGDIIDGRRVTKVYDLCGGLAYQSEPVGYVKTENSIHFPEEPKEVEKPKRGRRKKEV